MHVCDFAPAHADAVSGIVTAAFDRPEEAHLVDALRDGGKAVIELVALHDGVVVGHILFSPVTADDAPDARLLGLAPVSVSPHAQRQGLGGALIREGLSRAAALGYQGVVLLGHPEYYPRFGFVPASRFGIRCEYDCPDEAFMALPLAPGALDNIHGLVKYAPEFATV